MEISANSHSFYTNYELAKNNLAVSMKRIATGDPFSASGYELGSKISMSNSLKAKIASAQSSTGSIKNAKSFINTADAFLRATYDMVNQMTQLAASASDPLKTTPDRQILNQEYQAVKNEISLMARSLTFQEMQTIGREVMTTYDENTERITFFQPTGIGKDEFSRSFGSSAIDVNGTFVGFDKEADFTMDREGEAMFFLGADSSGDYHLKRYDIEADKVFSSSENYNQQDTLFVDESGALYVNNGGILKQIDGNTLEVKDTISSDLRSAVSFSIYQEVATYQKADESVVSYDINSTIETSLLTTPQLSSAFSAGSVDHAFSASGEFVADESEDGKIRIISTNPNLAGTLSEFVLDIGDADSVDALQFNEDGNRVYFIDKNSNAIKYAEVRRDLLGNVSLSLGGKVVQGKNNSLNGLDLGGVNPSSNYKFAISQDGTKVIDYEAVDLRTYNLGLANTNLLSVSAAGKALESAKNSVNRINFERSQFGSVGLRLNFVEQGHLDFISNSKDFNNFISNVDLAEETTRMQSLQIASQVSQAMLAQFNASQADVLQLLR
jgi:flagellin-like hook-associated protein FlgL